MKLVSLDEVHVPQELEPYVRKLVNEFNALNSNLSKFAYPHRDLAVRNVENMYRILDQTKAMVKEKFEKEVKE